jgi:hypothetical protein
MKWSQNQGIDCNKEIGPVFGRGGGSAEKSFDIYLTDKSNTNTKSSANLGWTYTHPGKYAGGFESYTFLAGSKDFQVSEIEIYTNHIQQIKPTQNHEMIYKLIQCLCEQQEHLQSIGYSFYSFHLEDIIMTDNNFFCLNDRNICKITKENTFSLFFPFSKNSFLSPELLSINQLPNHTIPISSFYYSLGSLVVFLLLDKYLLVGNELKSAEEINKILQPLYNTKVF